MNFRIDAASKVLRNIKYDSILDVGCRRCDLKNSIEDNKDYNGCDLF